MVGLVGFAFTVMLLIGSCANGQLLFSSMSVGFKEFAALASGLNKLSTSTKSYHDAMFKCNTTWKTNVMATLSHMTQTYELMKANTNDSGIIAKLNSAMDNAWLKREIGYAESSFTEHIQTLGGDIRRTTMDAIQAVDEGYGALDALTATSTSPNARACFDQIDAQMNGNVSIARLATCIDTETSYTDLVGRRIGILFNQATPDFTEINKQQRQCSFNNGHCFMQIYVENIWQEASVPVNTLSNAANIIRDGLENSHWRITSCLARTVEDIKERMADFSFKLQTCLMN